jgi:hypothetical protein
MKEITPRESEVNGLEVSAASSCSSCFAGSWECGMMLVWKMSEEEKEELEM